MSALLNLPTIKDQTAFNLDRWDQLARDEEVRKLPGRVETDRFGRTIMYNYAEYSHGSRQGDVWGHLRHLLPDGHPSVECPISTTDGIKVADVAWVSKKRLLKIGGRTALSGAPEICVEVISPGNTRGEIEEKRRLYFEAGAKEVWICDKRGKMIFFLKEAPAVAAKTSKLCPEMPKTVA
ncbi:Uma2 family endonuclease [Prosthecobacter algae]|uniref:Uma2 family endonuclease n=1 Tax=Prosthecobacter algae TaxID=1144682 RepID=A0ABP9PQ46_9BACT